METRELLSKLKINQDGEYSSGSYVIDLEDSDNYGKVYSKLEKSDILEPMQENQVVTLEGSSLMYKTLDDTYIVNLISDWEGNKYQLVINKI